MLAQGNQKAVSPVGASGQRAEDETAHIATLETHVEGNTGYAKLASSRPMRRARPLREEIR